MKAYRLYKAIGCGLAATTVIAFLANFAPVEGQPHGHRLSREALEARLGGDCPDRGCILDACDDSACEDWITSSCTLETDPGDDLVCVRGDEEDGEVCGDHEGFKDCSESTYLDACVEVWTGSPVEDDDGNETCPLSACDTNNGDCGSSVHQCSATDCESTE